MRIAILGTGTMGQEHARSYAWLRETEDVELAGVVGRDATKAKNLGAEVDAPAFTDPSKVLEDDSIEAIDITYPSGLHREYAVAALERGKHVICETPMALSLDDADAMINAAKAHNKILMVAQTMRFVSSYAALREKVLLGEIGAPRLAVARRLISPYWSDERPRDFAQYGEPVMELMIFDFDFLNWVLGEPARVYATGVKGATGAIEHAFVSVEYDKARALVEGSAMMPRSFPFTTSVRVGGEKGMLELTQRFKGEEVPETTFISHPVEGTTGTIEVPGQWPQGEECRYFIRCLQGKAEPGRLSPENERKALRVALAALESAERGDPVYLS